MTCSAKEERIRWGMNLHGSAALVILFAFLLREQRFIALLLLATATFLIIHWSWSIEMRQLEKVIGLQSSKRQWYGVCLVGGVLLAELLRWLHGETILPGPARPFLMMAFIIGGTEELLFRGYFLGRLHMRYGQWAAIIVAALYHTGYKSALFLFHVPVNLTQYAANTFLLGLLLGLARARSGSIWPVLLGHALFDMLYYFDRTTPWWVW